jgi:hypothetical protein
MATLSTIKNYIGNQMNTADGATPDSVRDGLINDALREIYNFRPWNILKKTASLSNGSTLPTDYNQTFDPFEVYYYTGTTKVSLAQASLEDIESAGASDEHYAIDVEHSKIIVKSNSSTVSFSYSSLPVDYAVDGSQDTSVVPLLFIDPAKYLALSMFWMSQERATGKQQLYFDQYTKAITDAQSKDNNLGVSRRFIHPLANKAVGFNQNRI